MKDNLDYKQFVKIYPIYIRRENGDAVSIEATASTVNQVYWFGIIKEILG